jgi:hypothetical protein
LPVKTDVNPDILKKQYKTKLYIHKKLRTLRADMYDMFVISPQDYFEEFKTRYTENEEGAVKKLKRILNGINNDQLPAKESEDHFNLNRWEKLCWPQDKKNIETIRSVFKQIITAIQDEENPIITATYFEFDHATQKWSTKTIRYPWTYL